MWGHNPVQAMTGTGKTGKAQCEQMFSAVHPTTDIFKIGRRAGRQRSPAGIAEYWAKLADIEDGQGESTVGETTGGLNDSRSMRSRLASYLSRPLSEIR